MVLMFHTNLWYVGRWNLRDTTLLPLFDQGYTGVGLFMVISGMILTIITYDRVIDVKSFYLNRLLRIYPVFVFVVTLGYFSTPDPRPTSIGLDYLMALLPISNLYRLQYGAYGGVLFSVMIEMQFYLIFPVLIAVWRRWNAGYYLALIGFMIVLRAIVFALNGTVHHFAYFSLFGNLDIFLIGCLAGVVYRRTEGRQIGWIWFPIAFVLANIAIYLAHQHSSFFHFDYAGASHNEVSRSRVWILWPTFQGVMWAGVILAYLRSSFRLPWSAVWSYLGRISYSLYAWHTLVCMVVVGYAALAGSPYLTGLLIVFPASVALASLSYYLIEAPFLAMRVRYLKPQVAAVPQQPADQEAAE